MLSDRIHPATIIMVWSCAVCCLMFSVSTLPWFAVAGLFVILAVLVPLRFRLMLRRMRFLLLAVALSFPLITPGQVIPVLPWVTYEGLALAAQQLVTLSLIAGMVALLMTSQSMNQLMLGLLVLVTPLSWLGLDTRPFAVRLGLTLEAISSPSASPAYDVTIDQPDVQARYCVPSIPWRFADALAISGAVLVCATIYLRGWSFT